MAYQPYQDIDSLLGSVKRSSEGVTAKQVEDILKSNQVFYKSSYSGVSDRIGDTKNYIASGQAYRDEGAKAIRAAYAVQADAASAGAAAQGAAENEGNLDSYAAAQANRQKQAFMSEGEKAVAERAAEVHSAMIDADKNQVLAMDTVQKATNTGGSAMVSNAKNAASTAGGALDDLLDYYGILAKN